MGPLGVAHLERAILRPTNIPIAITTQFHTERLARAWLWMRPGYADLDLGPGGYGGWGP